MRGLPLLWLYAGVGTAILFFASVALNALCVLQKNYRLLPFSAAVMVLNYGLLQAISICLSREAGEVPAAVRMLFTLPAGAVPALLAGAAVCTFLLMRHVRSYYRSRISPMSVKEATDGLPSGICFYLPGGRVLMRNTAMEEFCRKTTGGPLVNGSLFRNMLFSGELLPECSVSVVDEMPVIFMPDGTARSVIEKKFPFRNGIVQMLFAADVTELWRKMLSLRDMREKLSELNRRLTVYNREIVDATAERELLLARMKMHDEMGADLLVMKHYIQNGGTESERADVEARFRRNVSFLKTGQTSVVRDEYDLMLETAEKLGVQVCIQGDLPQREPQKKIIASAIHECFTNTLRHAHGKTLFLEIKKDGEDILAVFSNDGEQPKEEICEGGGLSSLRKLTEKAGGSMEISVSPVFRVMLRMPGEVSDGI